jgi:hypothetical protein
MVKLWNVYETMHKLGLGNTETNNEKSDSSMGDR